MRTLPVPSPSFNPSYVGLRKDIAAILPASPRKVLDVGCALGSMGRYLAERCGAETWGVEYDGAMAEVARTHLRGVFHVDLNHASLASLDHAAAYDLVICGDVLEHLVDPWAALRDVVSLLTPDGRVAVSLPNVGHYSTLVQLGLLRRWPHRERGIHDRTHLRFFTRQGMVQLYEAAGLRIVAEHRVLRFAESGGPLDPLAKLFDFHPFRSFLTFQYVHLLERG